MGTTNATTSDERQRSAIVTGGSQGLGLALTRALVAAGWHVVTDARRADRLDAALGDVEGGTALVGDVTDAEHRDALVAAATVPGRELRLVVNNASTLGASPLPALDAIDLDVLRTTYEVNVVAPIGLVQAALPHLGEGATVVNITSDAGVEAYETWGGYGSSKAALEHASRVLAAEHPELRVLVVDPGDMRTEMHQDAFPGEDIGDRPGPETSVAGLLDLIDGDQPSGRHSVQQAPEQTEPVPQGVGG
jgi:NAD(P)-dependent dehydrogenase (short-subunit alcohol dehydrogenase family)